MEEIVDLLAARSGTVCTVGAGGKKTTLHLLAARHPGRIGITTTVFTAPFPSQLGAHVVIAEPGELVAAVTQAAAAHRLIAFAHPSTKKARYAGLSDETLAEISQIVKFDVLLVKGDGARMRWIKAPDHNEPAIPAQTTTAIPVVSAKAIGATLSDETAHRVERIEAVTGARRGQRLTPTHIGRLLSHSDGALKDVGDATVVPVINMVDDEASRHLAVDSARTALELTDRFDHVVLTSTQRPDPLVEVVTRSNKLRKREAGAER